MSLLTLIFFLNMTFFYQFLKIKSKNKYLMFQSFPMDTYLQNILEELC